ncbi:glycosyltransferase [Pseudotamlana agarivorans]|uniref:glycosyltransferase n=1 Tax=Pseudotamlana agarivorans TaxID=481183 RepID=UPI000830D0F8|nr:glycosyltransferase [Tamlana agarivorans]
MRILLVSMSSIHFFRWTNQLEQAGHEVYWFDIRDGEPSNRIPFVKQIHGWKQKYPNLKGRHFFKKKLPKLYERFNFLIENKVEDTFESLLQDIKPDLVHSFALQISCIPILDVMKKYINTTWVYSAWGSDLFYKNNKPNYENDLREVLLRVDYLFTDCLRDYQIALNYGFKGEYLGCFPGGGGFYTPKLKEFILTPISGRSIILVKGYQGEHGRCIQVIKALIKLSFHLKKYKIIVFAADEEVVSYVEGNNICDILNIKLLYKDKFISHLEILKLMGASLIYIGNSQSDGMPNTLLEAITMGAFPLQSNPGNATSEIINHGENGFLIEDIEDVEEMEQLVLKALFDMNLLINAFNINQVVHKPRLERKRIKGEVLAAYNSIH